MTSITWINRGIACKRVVKKDGCYKTVEGGVRLCAKIIITRMKRGISVYKSNAKHQGIKLIYLAKTANLFHAKMAIILTSTELNAYRS
jgi:hypothetical protein